MFDSLIIPSSNQKLDEDWDSSMPMPLRHKIDELMKADVCTSEQLYQFIKDTTNQKVDFTSGCPQEITITPKMAQILLMFSNGNRQLNTTRIKHHIQDIERNQFYIGNDMIIVDKSWNLTNGHHRLTSVVQANKSIKQVIRFNVENHESKVIDIGIPRDVQDVAFFQGVDSEHNTRKNYTVIRMAMTYVRANPTQNRIYYKYISKLNLTSLIPQCAEELNFFHEYFAQIRLSALCAVLFRMYPTFKEDGRLDELRQILEIFTKNGGTYKIENIVNPINPEAKKTLHTLAGFVSMKLSDKSKRAVSANKNLGGDVEKNNFYRILTLLHAYYIGEGRDKVSFKEAVLEKYPLRKDLQKHVEMLCPDTTIDTLSVLETKQAIASYLAKNQFENCSVPEFVQELSKFYVNSKNVNDTRIRKDLEVLAKNEDVVEFENRRFSINSPRKVDGKNRRISIKSWMNTAELQVNHHKNNINIVVDKES